MTTETKDITINIKFQTEPMVASLPLKPFKIHDDDTDSEDAEDCGRLTSY